MSSHIDAARQQRRSLLSSSLAGEKNFTLSSTTQLLLQQQQSDPSTKYLHQKHNSDYHMLCINEVLDEEKASNTQYLDHPEPQLLASSVGKDLDGKLIPSSSTISLLSLNQDVSLKYNEQQQLTASVPKNTRTTSYSNLQRLQPYQRANTTSPPAQQQQQQLPSLSLPDSAGFQTLTITSNNAAANTTNSVLLSTPGTIPNSPNLDPVSLGGSPSRFWLSSQTPPSSSTTTNVMKNRSNSQTLILSLLQQLLLHSQPQYIVHRTGSGTGTIYKATRGDDSPVLNPVQTPIEDPPMTPLFLSSVGGVKHVDYFSHYHANNSELREEALEEEEEEENSKEYHGQKPRSESMILVSDVYN